MKIFFLFLSTTLIFISVKLYSQDYISDTTKTKQAESDIGNVFDMSLEDLMNVPIVSASREKEDVFNAPVSAYVITRQEIEKAGSTSIPEALRLCPGVFVTEMANGTYQVDIRGLNNTPSFTDAILNKTTLVMVDNRPVFNQFLGGTYWENLPVEINDVERIEVVAGPSAALYGPNAVSGVINIITRRLEKKGPMAYSNSQFDVATGSYMTNLSAGYKVNDKLSFIVSGNYSNRKRYVEDFYSTGNPTNTGSYSSYDELNTDPRFQKQNLYPDPSLAINKKAVNFYAEYAVSQKVKFDFSAGYQDSDPLRMLVVGAGTAMHYSPSNSMYVRGKGELNGFSFQISNNQGLQSIVKGAPSYQYDFRTTDFYVDYTFKYKTFGSLKPAFSYQNAFVSDVPYKDQDSLGGVFNNKAGMYNYAGSVKLELTPIKLIRFVAAVRADRFRLPTDKTFYSYEFALNIKPNEKHNIRLIASRAYQGSYMFPTFVNFSFFKPNYNLNPPKIDLFELGYRMKLTEFLNIDLSIFRQEGSGYYGIVSHLKEITIPFPPPGRTIGVPDYLRHESIDLKAIQTGVTLSLNAVLWDKKIQFKPFITVSETQLKNYTPYINTPTSVDYGLNIYNHRNVIGKATPSWYGGFFLNITPISKLTINLSGYSYANYSVYTFLEQPNQFQTSYTSSTYTNFVSSPASDIKMKFMMNMKVSYQVQKYIKVFVNGRNIFNNMNREFYAGDQIGAMYLAGFTLDY